MRGNRKRPKTSAAIGMTLVELLVSIVLGGVVGVPFVNALAVHTRALERIDARVMKTETLRVVVDVFGRDVRQAGFDPTGHRLAAIVSADATSIAMQADSDGDGIIDARSDERIAYVFHPTRGVVSRIVGHQSMPLADGFPPDGVRFRFFDGVGREIWPRPEDPATAEVIRRVRLTLRLDADSDAAAFVLSADVSLRNLPWTP